MEARHVRSSVHPDYSTCLRIPHRRHATLRGARRLAFVWLTRSRNPYTPAGYVGYLTKDAVFGKARFHGVQRGPTSAGRQWLVHVANVSVTPYTYNEDFVGDDAVLSRDNLKISFRVHTVWRLDDTKVPLFMERYSTTVSRNQVERDPDSLVKIAYGHFIREPLRTYARDEVQRRNGLEVKDELITMATLSLHASGPTPRTARSSSAAWSSATCSTRGSGGRRVTQARRDAGVAAEGHGDRDRAKERAAA